MTKRAASRRRCVERECGGARKARDHPSFTADSTQASRFPVPGRGVSVTNRPALPTRRDHAARPCGGGDAKPPAPPKPWSLPGERDMARKHGRFPTRPRPGAERPAPRFPPREHRRRSPTGHNPPTRFQRRGAAPARPRALLSIARTAPWVVTARQLRFVPHAPCASASPQPTPAADPRSRSTTSPSPTPPPPPNPTRVRSPSAPTAATTPSTPTPCPPAPSWSARTP